jgi:Mrp family chromosome partitioning ATPase
MDAIGGEDIIECVTPTAVPGLSILPLGQATAEDIGGLSPAMLRQVLEATRDKYDVVIVDTGPILGSLEAAMVATQADDVVMVVSNGENRAAAERSLHYLEMVGARVAGFVFNRATPRDFNGTGSISRSRANSSASHWRNSGSWRESNLSNFGPVAQAVAHSVSGIDKENAGGNNGNGKAS